MYFLFLGFSSGITRVDFQCSHQMSESICWMCGCHDLTELLHRSELQDRLTRIGTWETRDSPSHILIPEPALERLVSLEVLLPLCMIPLYNPGDVQRTLCPHIEERLVSLGLRMRLLPLCARQKEETGQESTQHAAGGRHRTCPAVCSHFFPLSTVKVGWLAVSNQPRGLHVLFNFASFTDGMVGNLGNQTHLVSGQRLAIILPHIIQKLAQLSDPEVGKLLQMLQQQLQLVTESGSDSNDNFHKKLRQVQIHRSLERMNCSALLDLAMSALPEHILQTFAAVQSQMFPSLSLGEQMVLPEGSVFKFWLWILRVKAPHMCLDFCSCRWGPGKPEWHQRVMRNSGNNNQREALNHWTVPCILMSLDVSFNYMLVQYVYTIESLDMTLSLYVHKYRYMIGVWVCKCSCISYIVSVWHRASIYCIVYLYMNTHE